MRKPKRDYLKRKNENADNMNMLIELLVLAIVLHWSIISISTIIGLFSFLSYKAKRSKKPASNYEIVVVSKASYSVENALFRCLVRNSARHKLNLVIDEGAKLEKRLRKFCKRNGVGLCIVPSSFKCKAVAKGRAIQYFISAKILDPGRWYIFIDDDNYITDDSFLYEIPYYEKKGYVALNGLLYPKKTSSQITYIADFLRYFDDLTLFRSTVGLMHRPLSGLHGELLGVKGSVLKEVTFDRKSITEDFAFAAELVRRGYKVWQSSTRIEILSPHTVSDFLIQRRRWFKGICSDIKDAPWQMKLVAGTRIVDWYFGAIGSWMLFPLWFVLPFNFSMWFKIFLTFGILSYFGAYIYGSSKSQGLWKFGFLLLPVYSVLESLAPHYWKKTNGGFEVIRK